MSGMFPQLDVPSWIGRLREKAESFRSIAGAAELAAAEDSTVVAPACFVYPLREAAEANPYGTGHSQRVTAYMGVVIAVKNLRDPRGAAAQQDLKRLRQEVFDALIAWAPDADSSPVNCAGARLVRFNNAVLWWQDDFTTQFHRRVI